MKFKIFRMIFRKEIDAYNRAVSEARRKMRQEMQDAIEKEKTMYSVMKDAFAWYSDAKILGIYENKIGHELIVVLANDTIFLMGKSYSRGSVPRLYFKVNYTYNDYKRVISGIYIQDVLMIDNNIGNGSIAMEALIKYAKEIGAPKITGWLSPQDNDHAHRRNHYYEKFGFKIVGSHVILDLINKWED